MPEVPNTFAGSLGRLAGSRNARHRVGRALYSAVTTTGRACARVVHVLFLEVTGLLFICLSVALGSVAVREYYKYRAGAVPAYKVALATGFSLMFLWFSVSSFWRARRRRSR